MKNYIVNKWLMLAVIVPMLIACGSTNNQVEETVPYPKNIIYLVGDGMGYNHVLATNYYQYGSSDMQPYEQADWLHLAQATYNAARFRNNDTLYHNGYSPRRAWEDADYLMTDYTDSGAAATALSTGQKVFDGSIGLAMGGDTLTHISQAAKARGKAAGIVSSVPLSHATPAGFAAHNRSRQNYEEIGQYLLFHTRLDLIMAPGHPDYNNDGQAEEMSARYVGGREIWAQIAANDAQTEFTHGDRVLFTQDVNGDGARDPWTFIESREDFVALATGPAPARVLGIPKVYSTLHQGRSGQTTQSMPFEFPLNDNVPTLEEMTRAALNVLGQNNEGFFVMIEGGAIDWASHDNDLVRTIEEQMDFNNSVLAAIEWVETHSSWEETLIIVTSDHECGFLTGPNHPNPVNDPVDGRGQGELPDIQWNFDTHTNTLVPFYAKGPGTELFDLMADERDPVRGRFLQNTEIAQAIFLMWGKPQLETHRLGN